MYTKAEIFNLALGALLLQRQIDNPDTDKSNEAKILLARWDVARNSTLEDLDLDSTSDQITLSLVATDPNTLWSYAYTYPSDCVFFRRLRDINEMKQKDNRYTYHAKEVRMYSGQKVIMTDLENAVAEYISKDVPLSSLSPNVGLAIAYKLAWLSAPLIVGKGAQKLREEIKKDYVFYKAEAQEKDRRENHNFHPESVESDWVNERLS